MEVKINKEIRDYTENIYFGLSLRQFICSLLGCAAAVFFYFTLKSHVDNETLSWICMISVVPFAFVGFVKYNGMTAEQFLIAFIESEILTSKKLTFNPTNYYYELVKDEIEGGKKNVKNNKKSICSGQGKV